MEDVDTDGDGVADWVEILYGSDPLDPSSMPGPPKDPSIPTLSPVGLTLLAVLLIVAFWTLHRRRRGVPMGDSR